jgi:transcriptional regulator with XRE-family HTH domain
MTIETAVAAGPSADDYSDETSTFGDRLLLARESVGFSQAQLGRRMGVKIQTLKNWEEDRSEPRANKLQMLAGMLNVSMVWLMSGRGDAPQMAVNGGGGDDAQAFLADLRGLRTEQVRLAEKMARLEKRLRVVIAQ